MNLPTIPLVDNFFNFLFGLPPYILIPVLIIGGFLIIRAIFKIFIASAKNAAGAVLILLLVTVVCVGGFFLFSKMPDIVNGVAKVFHPIFH